MIRVREMNLHPDAPRQKLTANVKLVASYQKNPAKSGGTTAKPLVARTSTSPSPAPAPVRALNAPPQPGNKPNK